MCVCGGGGVKERRERLRVEGGEREEGAAEGGRGGVRERRERLRVEGWGGGGGTHIYNTHTCHYYFSGLHYCERG